MADLDVIFKNGGYVNVNPIYNYMVNYRQYPPKYNKEKCGSLGIVSDTMMKSPTNLSCGSQRMGMETGEVKNDLC